MDIGDKLARVSGTHTKGMIFKFHRWADSYTYVDDKPFAVTMAILENVDSGEVSKINPNDLTFISEEEAISICLERRSQ